MDQNTSGSISLFCKVSTVSVGSLLVNLATITSTGTETDPFDNRATCTTRVISPEIDLFVAKEGPSEIVANSVIKYDIWYGNKGTVEAMDVVITDTLPSGCSYLSDTLGGTNTGQIIWNIGTLAPGQQGYIRLSVSVGNLEASSILTNLIEISSSGSEKDYTNNCSTVITHIAAPTPDLFVRKQGPDEVAPGNEIVYQIGYGNMGNIGANDDLLADILPDGVEYISDTSGITPTISGKSIIWTIPNGTNLSTIVIYSAVISLTTKGTKNLYKVHKDL